MAKKSKRKATREPDCFDPLFEPELEEAPIKQVPKYKAKLVYLIDRDEVNALINAPLIGSSEEASKLPNTNYTTYTQAETLALLNSDPVLLKPIKKKK